MYKAVTLAGGIREPLLTCSSFHGPKGVRAIEVRLYVKILRNFDCLYKDLMKVRRCVKVSELPLTIET